MPRILIVDDEANIRTSLKNALERRNHEAVTAANLKEGREFITAGFDIIILDVKLPDGNGLDLLRDIFRNNPQQMVVMISGHADVATAVEAIRLGAFDFIEKPLSLDRVLVTIDNATRTTHLQQDKDRLSHIIYGDFIGKSEVIRQLLQSITRSASKTERFLITGENGTGKELVAHLIHRQSRYARGSFVPVNCAALPSELVEAELFGHTAGAFTGATKARPGKFIEAGGGSIFLDEISEMPPEAQAKILRVVETRAVIPVGSNTPVMFSGNIIAASNRNLEAMVIKVEMVAWRW